MSRQGISVQPIWEIKLSYYLLQWVFTSHISQYLMEIVLTFITWLLLYCALLVHAMTKPDNDLPASKEENGGWKKKKKKTWIRTDRSNSQCPKSRPQDFIYPKVLLFCINFFTNIFGLLHQLQLLKICISKKDSLC